MQYHTRYPLPHATLDDGNPHGQASTKQPMTLQNFIDEYRAELTRAITKRVPNIRTIDDEEIRLWILNDEGLYHWAKEEGVRI